MKIYHDFLNECVNIFFKKNVNKFQVYCFKILENILISKSRSQMFYNFRNMFQKNRYELVMAPQSRIVD